MNITSIGTSYTPLRSSQSFGLKYGPKMSDIIEKCKTRAIADNELDVWKEGKKMMDKSFPNTWTLDVNEYNHIKLTSPKKKVYSIDHSEDFVGDNADPDATVFFYLAGDLTQLKEQIEIRKMNILTHPQILRKHKQ